MRPQQGRRDRNPAAESEAYLSRAYRPLHKSFLITVVVYFAYVTVAHLFEQVGSDAWILSGFSLLTLITGAAALAFTAAGRLARPAQVEVVNGVVHMALLSNVIAYQFLHYDPSRLVYFPLLAVAFALSAISRRAMLASVIVTLASMLGIVVWFDPGAVQSHILFTVATAFTAIGLSTFLHGVLSREVTARIVADRVAAEALAISAENARLAKIDALTGLPNRRRFFELVEAALLARPERPALVAGIVDLDGFKAVNDVFGHGIGDRVLLEVGERLTAGGRLPAVIARMGGDEFGILIEGDPSDQALVDNARDLADCLVPAFRFETAVATLSGSFGFARARAGDTAASVLDRADYAAYEAKHRVRGRAVLFSQHHEELIVAERKLERALLHADLETEIVPVFQPIVDGVTRITIGYEALARWHSPELGDVSPAVFIPMAERLGLVPRITQSMTRHVLEAMPLLPRGMRVSVNLSPRDLASSDAMRAISAILGTAAIRPCLIDFEITETAVMNDIGEAMEALLVLMAHGARISLDDFGTGHSSLSRVQLLPLDRIKVDRSFVTAIETDRASQAIVKTTIDLCRNLGVSCVVEGVETERQLAALQGLGARYFQGYLFGRPAPVSQILSPAARLRA